MIGALVIVNRVSVIAHLARVRNCVAAPGQRAIRPAGVGLVPVVAAVVALFRSFKYISVAANVIFTGRQAGVRVRKISIVTFFRVRPYYSIPAPCIPARSRAIVGVIKIAVIAFFNPVPHVSVPADGIQAG